MEKVYRKTYLMSSENWDATIGSSSPKVTARSSGKGEVELGAFSEAPGGAAGFDLEVHVCTGEQRVAWS